MHVKWTRDCRGLAAGTGLNRLESTHSIGSWIRSTPNPRRAFLSRTQTFRQSQALSRSRTIPPPVTSLWEFLVHILSLIFHNFTSATPMIDRSNLSLSTVTVTSRFASKCVCIISRMISFYLHILFILRILLILILINFAFISSLAR